MDNRAMGNRGASRNGLLTIFFIIFMLFTCAAMSVLIYVPESEMVSGSLSIWNNFQRFIAAILAAIALAVLGGLVRFGWQIWETGWIKHLERLLLGAEVQLKEREANFTVTVAAPGSQVYTHRVKNFEVYTDPVYLSPGRINGVAEPTPEEVQRWAFYNLAQNISKKPELATEQPLALAAPLPERVYLEHYAAAPSLAKLFLGVGRTPDGQVGPVSAPLSHLVHIAVAGSSGFGKSTFMQATAWQCVNAKERPACVLLDAQGVTFSAFDAPNLLYPAASEPGDIRAILAELVGEMIDRQKKFARWRGVDRLSRYNAAVEREGRADEKLFEIVTIFDEFGLLAGDKEIAGHIDKLSKGARKAGIYLIAGSQTWGADEISTAIRANLSTSVQFNARDKAQSRVLLGNSAAADLTRPGQAYAILPGRAGLIELIAPDPSGLVEVEPVYIGDGDDFLTAMRPLPTPEQADEELSRINPERVLELWDSGKYETPTAICRRLLGYKKGKTVEEITQILIDAGRIG